MIKYIPRFIKDWIKHHPIVGNTVDKIMYGKREIAVFNDIKGMLGADEREKLFLMAKNLQPGSVIVEIGCFSGLSTYFLGKGAKLSHSKIYSIDPFAHAVERQVRESDSSWYIDDVSNKPSLKSVHNILIRHGLDDVVTLIEGFGQEVARRWHDKVDLLWIDGNHLEAYGDYHAWKKHLSSHAIVAFHDSFGPNALPEVMRDVERIIDEEKPIEIKRCRTITTLTFTQPVNLHVNDLSQEMILKVDIA